MKWDYFSRFFPFFCLCGFVSNLNWMACVHCACFRSTAATYTQIMKIFQKQFPFCALQTKSFVLCAADICSQTHNRLCRTAAVVLFIVIETVSLSQCTCTLYNGISNENDAAAREGERRRESETHGHRTDTVNSTNQT